MMPLIKKILGLRDIDEIFLEILILLDFDAANREVLVQDFEKSYEAAHNNIRLYIAVHHKYDFLLVRLKHLKEHLPAFYEKQAKILKTQKEYLVFYGFKFEIDIAYSLSIKGIEFSSPDPPDFSIENNTCQIECTTAISKTNEESKEKLLKKVLDKLKEKEGKNTAKVTCALFINTTNLLSHASKFAQEFYDSQLKVVSENMNHSKYGSILVFNFIAQSMGNYSLHYWRIDSNDISEDLKNFLDKHYPFQEKITSKKPLLPKFG